MASYGIEWGASANDWIMHTLVIAAAQAGGYQESLELGRTFWNFALFLASLGM
jgi:hypothetical protein